MNSTGKKARRTGGTRFACKRNRARNRQRKEFGKLTRWSPAEVESFNARVAKARRLKTGDPNANVAVEI